MANSPMWNKSLGKRAIQQYLELDRLNTLKYEVDEQVWELQYGHMLS